jgi:hypothetical protein
MDKGSAATVIEVIVKGADVTVMFAVPETFVNPAWAELAVQVPVPMPDGVKIPPEVIVPPVAVQVTAELNAPVPVTVATQVEVCAVVMEDGVATTETPVTVTVGGAAVTAMFAEPDTFVNPVWAEWAVQAPVPVPEGVKTPLEVIVPPVAVQVTAVLYGPVPVTVATHVEVCAVVMEDGVATTETPVTVG